MQIRTDKLRKYLALLEPIVPKKSTIPTTKFVRLMDGKITATDLETTVIFNLAEASGVNMLLPAKDLADTLKYIPGGDLLTIDSLSEKSVKVSWSSGSATITTEKAADFPVLDLPDNGLSSGINGDFFVRAIVAALPYCASEGSRPSLAAVGVQLGETVTVGATDGFRLSFQTIRAKYPEDHKILIPPISVKIIENLWKNYPPPVSMTGSFMEQVTGPRLMNLSVTETHLIIKYGDMVLASKLVPGNVPDYLMLLTGNKEAAKVSFMAPDLLNAIKRLTAFSKKGIGAAKLRWKDNKMSVSSVASGDGGIETSFDIEPVEQPGRIAIQCAYLIKYLSDKDGLITMACKDDKTPAFFNYLERPIVCLMPFQVKWEEDPEAPVEDTKAAEQPNEEVQPAESTAQEEESGEDGEPLDQEGNEEPTESVVSENAGPAAVPGDTEDSNYFCPVCHQAWAVHNDDGSCVKEPAAVH